MSIKVRAKAPGVYGSYMELGEEFDIKGEEQFSDVWMEKVIDPEEVEETSAKGKLKGKGRAKASADSDADTIASPGLDVI